MKILRVKKKKEFSRVLRAGKRAHAESLTIIFLPSDRTRFAVCFGKKYGKTPAQVILRWHLQRNIPVIPRTVHKERMAENMDIRDFTLTGQEMEAIGTMDIGHSEIIDHHSFCTARQLNSLKIHP